jgi:omega-6 fatty acid desaturase (delta-12 desaturase)
MNQENLGAVRKQFGRNIFFSPLWKGVFYFARDILLFGLFSSLILLTNNLYLLFPLWILQGLSILALFQLGHDIAHGALFKNRILSWWLGQICLMPSLHPYHQWVYGHNGIHHGNTSKLKSDLAWHPRSTDRFKSMSRLDKLLHRIYWSPYGSGIYYLFKMWFQGLILFPAPNTKAKRDILIILSFTLFSIGFSIYLGGSAGESFSIAKGFWIFTKLQLIPFIVWNYMIGIITYTQHINENIVWKKEGEWTPFYGQMQATTVYYLPAYINFFAHNIMLHVPHHVHAKIPFYNLPEALAIIKKDYAHYLLESHFFWRDYLHSTKHCKLIDSKTGKWTRY